MSSNLSQRRATPQHPGIERLEGRQLLSTAATAAAPTVSTSPLSAHPAAILANSSLTISGTAGPDTIVASVVSGGTLTISVNGTSTSYTLADVTSLEIDGYGGNDEIVVGLDVPPTLIRGEAGNDTILVNDAAGETGDTIRGGAGADSLHGGAGNDSIYGGPGNDTINGGGGLDTLVGGGGDDSVTAGSGGVEPGAGVGTMVLKDPSGDLAL